MNVLTRVFLVLLRVAIGWHFLFEGLDKLESHFGSYRDAKAPWSSEKYLLEAQGPLGPFFRDQAGDPHQAALGRLTLPEDRPGAVPNPPPALEADWKAQYDGFVAFYGVGTERPGVQPEMLHLLTAAPQAGFPAAVPWEALAAMPPLAEVEDLPRALLQDDFDRAKQTAVAWLMEGERTAERSFSKVQQKVTEKTPDRIRIYRMKLQELRDIEGHGFEAFDRDVWKQNLNALKREVESMRAELMADLNRPMKNALDHAYRARLTEKQRERGTPPQGRTWLWWIDRVTMYGLTAVGVCLLLGLFSRTACVAGAGLLMLFYLAMPALPWLPSPARAEGMYVFVNKNVIEALALLALATTASGRWAGLDGLIYWWRPKRQKITKNK